MNVLVINSGSSSVKYQLIDAVGKKVLAKGLCDRIGLEGSVIKHSVADKGTKVVERRLDNHRSAIQEVLKILMDKDLGVIHTCDEISAVGHRVVHGGEKFHDSVIIDDSVKQAIIDCSELAPLHNPANLTGIEACQELMPGKPMVAVFDTAFHQTMPPYSYLYALPYEIYEKYGIRKYGFHGTSHRYVAERASAILGRPLSELKIISCHLGNGASICAIKYGKSIDTSMGFTPLAGLAMGTRSGDIDPAIMLYLMKKENMSIDEIDDYLNKRSGVLGISGVSSDFRDVIKAAKEGNRRAAMAIKLFCYQVKSFIAEYAGVMNGVDAIIFTAGIGENNPAIRRMILYRMNYLGISINPSKNKVQGKEMDISNDDSTVKVLVIPTNEELAIAKETLRLISRE